MADDLLIVMTMADRGMVYIYTWTNTQRKKKKE